MSEQRKYTRPNPVKVNFWWDLAIFGGFLAAFAPGLTGLALHEWLSLAFGATLVVHILLHWKWLAAVTRNFLKSTTGQARINYILNAALFVITTVIIFSGVMESQAVLPALGLQAVRSPFWRSLHHTFTNLALLLIGVHIALHWKWVLSTFKKYAIAPLTGAFRRTPHSRPVEHSASSPLRADNS